MGKEVDKEPADEEDEEEGTEEDKEEGVKVEKLGVEEVAITVESPSGVRKTADVYFGRIKAFFSFFSLSGTSFSVTASSLL